MAVIRDLTPILKAMRRDKKYKRLKEAFDTLPLYQMPIEKLADEIETLHKTRSIRYLNVDTPQFVDTIVKANTQDQSVRGRLTEILMMSVRVTGKLEAALKTLRFHLLISFTDELKSYRTKEERLQIVDMVLQPFTKYIANIEMLRESAQLCVKDIDQGNFSLDKTLRSLEMHTSREKRI
jgi:FtsZ-binding cell division protein ZapB